MSSSTSLDVVVGAQFGSEAKGHVTKRVIERRLNEGHSTVINVRVAGPNAGHCVLDEQGNKFALRSLPVGAVFPNVMLHVAPGSEIELQVLLDEVTLLEEAGHSIRGRLTVSPEATVLTDQHKISEANAALTEKVGSTGKGIGAARADRLMRRANRVRDDEYVHRTLNDWGIGVHDWVKSSILHFNDSIIIEGTQGYGLGLHAGYYPQCTSSDTRAIDFCAMAGLNPWDFDRFNIWAVARVFPIRVAGNSGPLKGETSWEELGLPEERTTVTKKVRRVGSWDPELVRDAVRANGRNQTHLALTMLDQQFPHLANMTPNQVELEIFGTTDDTMRNFIKSVGWDAGTDVRLVTTGEDTGLWLA